MFQVIILDADKLKEFYNNVESGFRKSPFEYILFAVLIGLGFLALLLFIIFQVKAARRNRKRTRERMRFIMQKKGLSPAEEKLVHRLTRYFPRDKRFLPDMLIRTNTFNACVNRMSAKEVVDDNEMAALRVKLGLNDGKSQAGAVKPFSHLLHSTAEFPRGSPVKLSPHGEGTFKGRIEEVGTRGIVISTTADAPRGSPLVLEVDSRSGCYLVHTRVLERGRGRLMAAHSERVERIQNRRFYRKSTRIPVTLKLPGDTGKLFYSYALDLSGGGARVKNPGFGAFRGLELLITLRLEGEGSLTLPAKVTRVSDRDSTFSLSFGPIKDAVRDKIMRNVLRR
jgi:hypothetical protein